MNNWKLKRIDSVVDIRRGASPRPIDAYLSDEGMPWVKISDATASPGRFIHRTQQCIKESGVKNSVIVNPEDLIISNSATPALPKIMKIRACVHDGWLVISAYSGITRDFLYYSIKLNRKWLLNQGNGSIFKNLKVDILKEFQIHIPSLDEQDKVTKILNCIEDMIDINNQIINKLEEMAKTTYYYWFVQFEFPNEKGKPYKSSGGKMVWNETLKRDIPIRWKVKKIEEVLKITRGASPRPIEEYLSEKGMPWVKISDATATDNRFITKTKQYIIEKGISKSRPLQIDTLILSNSASPAIPRIMKIEACVHDGWLIIDNYTHGITKEFMFHYFEQERPRIVNMGNGSIFKNLKTDYIKELNILLPPENLLKALLPQLETISETVYLRTKENQKLTELRDWLLPMLMNGQVKVG
jgi:type I restriction enzyme S subunit